MKLVREFIPFNLNEYIRVKLTDAGREIHRAEHEAIIPHIEYRPPRVDADGWSEFQAWCFMKTFGDHFRMGCEEPCEMEIQVQSVCRRQTPAEMEAEAMAQQAWGDGP